MYLIIEIEFKSDKHYIVELIDALATKYDVSVEVRQVQDKILLSAPKEMQNLEAYLNALEEHLPASIFLGKSSHYFAEELPIDDAIVSNKLPIDISLCPTCQKEMFDVSSRRYYYPFTACNACGSKHAFLTQYPMRRDHTSMKFLVPCAACKEEMMKNPLRRNYPLISCIDCGIALRMYDSENEHIANDKGSYRTLFEVAARAIANGKSVCMKTPHGHRKFFKPAVEDMLEDTIVLMCSANGMNEHLMMVVQEFNALLSIERPLVRVATKSSELKALYGSSAWVKYPDDGMTILLAKELLSAGVPFISYKECRADEKSDFYVDFDIPISSQKDFKLFINQDTKLVVSGNRVIFPALSNDKTSHRICIANGKASVFVEETKIIDELDRFHKMPAREVWILEDEPIILSMDNQTRFSGFKASMLSILAEHNKMGQSAIGVHFDDRLHFLYYNKKEVMDVVPPNLFEADRLFEHIKTLREGSDRLVENYKKAYPDIYERLEHLSGERNLFEVTAIMLGLQNESFEGISAEALSFLGKGGLQIDTKLKDNRFNDYSFLASIMSYQLSGVEPSLMCYSIYESFGDYIAEIVTQLMDKTKASVLTLSGETFANQSLWGRIQRNLGAKKPLLNTHYPIGKENVIFGAQYL